MQQCVKMDTKLSLFTASSYLRKTIGLIVLLTNMQKADSSSSIWTLWWNYEGISGPTMWGTMNRDWYMCSRGKNQSPIDIEPKVLLFDPTLKHIEIEGDLISGTLINNGVDLTFEYNVTKDHRPVNISLGPLSYKYTISEIKLHFGVWDGEGSEHSVNGHFFDGEMHIIAYNSDVYHNLSHAKSSPRGVAIIATFLQKGNLPNHDFDMMSNISQLILFKGQRARIKNLSIVNILPNIDNYITYEGSFTQPGCQETVTWVILNKPLTITQNQPTSSETEDQHNIFSSEPLALNMEFPTRVMAPITRAKSPSKPPTEGPQSPSYFNGWKFPTGHALKSAYSENEYQLQRRVFYGARYALSTEYKVEGEKVTMDLKKKLQTNEKYGNVRKTDLQTSP